MQFQQGNRVSNQYWEWCSIHARAFNSITIDAPRSRYAIVELDLYGLGAGGFDQEAGQEILRTILTQPLKPLSTFFVSPVYVYAVVAEKSAKLLASTFSPARRRHYPLIRSHMMNGSRVSWNGRMQAVVERVLSLPSVA